MSQKPRRSASLFSDFNNLQFAGVTGMVLFVILLLVFLMQPPSHIRAVSTDLLKVSHPVSMPGANREDTILIWVTRDGRAYLDADEAFGRWHKTRNCLCARQDCSQCSSSDISPNLASEVEGPTRLRLRLCSAGNDTSTSLVHIFAQKEISRSWLLASVTCESYL